MLSTSLFALKETTVSTVLILRNVLPLVSFVGEKWLFGTPQVVTLSHTVSLLVTFVGTVLYGYSNLSVTTFSATMIFINCIVTVADKLLQRYLLTSSEFKESLAACMLANNTIGAILLLVLACTIGETGEWVPVLKATSAASWLVVTISGISGCALGYLGLKIARMIDATMLLVLQNGTKVAVILMGIALYGDQITGISALGCVISLAGSAWYSSTVRPVTATPVETRNDGLKHIDEGKLKQAVKG